nr:S8 family serine peptidase [Eubacterium sp.]
MEIVAPGEVVRTTGFIGTEEVVSGTSLAAPQIAAVASLIWQKDPSVSADFVRGLLNESANQYGEEEAYGNGLVDAEYALKHYDEYKEKYEENAPQITEVQKDAETEAALIPENESEITTFEETGCVEGSYFNMQMK